MTSTPPKIPSRPHTPSPTPARAPRISLRSPSAPALNTRLTTSRTPSQATISALPPRLYVTAAMSTAASSPTSSVINIDLSESILIRDADQEDPEVAESEERAEGVFVEPQEDSEERKKILRDQLRRTLSRKDTSTRANIISSSNPDENETDSSIQRERPGDHTPDIKEVPLSIGEKFPQRQYFVCTDAGKPVFVSRPSDSPEDLTSITGIISALISVFADNTLSPSIPPSSTTDKLRCINAGSTRISFFLRPPLYYVCVSKWGEPESVTRMHLEYINHQIISVLTGSQLRRIFERRTNFDLRRLLEGTETFLHTLLHRLQSTTALYATLSALASLRMDPSVRTRIGDVLVPTTKSGALDILYVILVSGDSVVTIVRPRKHSVHPTDLHILLNALYTPSIAANTASWLPICLPKFNPKGFVHAYVSYLGSEQPELHPSNGKGSPPAIAGTPSRSSESSSSVSSAVPVNSIPEVETRAEGNPTPVERDITPRESEPQTKNENTGKLDLSHKPLGHRDGLSLVIVSGGGEFDAVRLWSDNVIKKLEDTGVMTLLRGAVKSAAYGCSELGIPGLRHFLYKSRVHVQATCPVWDDEYLELENQRRLITMYQTVHDAMHAKSGQESTLKLQYVRTDKEAVLGWITQPFELYIVLSPRLPKTAAVSAANAVARWAKREQAKLFLRDAPVF